MADGAGPYRCAGESGAGGQGANAEGGGQHAVFKRRVSGEVVGEFVESFVGSSSSEYSVVLADYAEMRATNFERTWLTP